METLEALRPLFQPWDDPEWWNKLFWWLVGGAAATLGWTLLLQSSRGVCRTPVETAHLLARISWKVCTTLVHYATRGFKPKFPKWTLRFELVQAIVRTTTDMFGDRIVDKKHARILRRQSELVGTFLGWFARQQHGMTLETVQFNGLEHIWLKSFSETTGVDTERLVVLYYHGGAYAVLSPRVYISCCSKLAGVIMQELAARGIDKDIAVDVFLANYRKVPEFQFPVQAEDAVTMYEYLLQYEGLQPSQIILAGDSAGGGLVLSTLLRVRDEKTTCKVKLPLAAIVLSPVTDLTGDEDVNEGPNCILSPGLTSACITNYHPTYGDPSTWADASPVQCDLRGLPPVLVQTGTFDYLFQHSLRLVAKAKADGVTNFELDEHEGMPHVFAFFPSYVLPYARIGFQRMAAFSVRQFVGGLAMDGKGAKV